MVFERAEVAADLPAAMLPVLLPPDWSGKESQASMLTACGDSRESRKISSELLEALVDELRAAASSMRDGGEGSPEGKGWGTAAMKAAKRAAKRMDKARRAGGEEERRFEGWPERVKPPMVLLPLRWCLTGSDSGAPIGNLLDAMGPVVTLARL